MNATRFQELSKIAVLEVFLLFLGNLLMISLFFTIIPAIVIQEKLPDSFLQEHTEFSEQQKVIQGHMQELLKAPGNLQKEYFTIASEKKPGLLVWNNVFWVVSFLLPALWLYRKFKQPFNNLSDKFQFNFIFYGFLTGMVTIFAVSVLTQIFLAMGLEIKGDPFHQILFGKLQNNQKLLVWSIYSIGILTGIIEEVFFRGFLLTPFLVKKFPVEGLIFSSLLFGFVHGGSALIPVILSVVGFIFGYSYLKTGNIWVPIIGHITYNSSLLLTAYHFGDLYK